MTHHSPVENEDGSASGEQLDSSQYVNPYNSKSEESYNYHLPSFLMRSLVAYIVLWELEMVHYQLHLRFLFLLLDWS